MTSASFFNSTTSSSATNYNPDDLHALPVSASTLYINYLTLQHAQSPRHSQWLTMPASLTYTPELLFRDHSDTEDWGTTFIRNVSNFQINQPTSCSNFSSLLLVV